MEQLHLLLVHLIKSSMSEFQIADTTHRILKEMSHSIFRDGPTFIIESYQNNIKVNTQKLALGISKDKHKT